MIAQHLYAKSICSLVVFCLIFSGCASDGATDGTKDDNLPDREVVDVKTTSMEFIAPDTIKSGWVTIRYQNNSPMVHLALVERMPDGKGIADHQDTVAPLFQNIMDQINGRPLSDPGVGTTPPAWMSDIVYIGGPGFVSPGQSTETTMYLVPGVYEMECYVKTNQVFHTYNPDPRVYGMIHQFIVIEEQVSNPEPEASISIDLSISGGMEIKDEITAGEHTIRVNYLDQKVYPNFLQHDVNVVRRESGADMDSLLTWIDWMDPTGLETPAPGGFTFVGGIHEMPAGSTGYFTTTFTPGEYVFFSEVQRPDTLGLLKVVNVSAGD